MNEKILLEETRYTTRFTAFATNIDENSSTFQSGVDAGMVPAYLTFDPNGIAQNIVKFSGGTILYRTNKNTFIPIDDASIDYVSGYTWSTDLPSQLPPANKDNPGIGSKYYNKFHKVADYLSSGRSQTHVIREEVPTQDYIVNIGLERSFDALDTLSVYNSMENGIPSQESNTGVVFGRLVANQKIIDRNGNAVKIPLSNVPIGIFQASEEFPTANSTDDNGNRIQMNFLNNDPEANEQFNYVIAHEGTDLYSTNRSDVKSKSYEFDQQFLSSSDNLESMPEHYKIVTKTNDNGEFILYDVPTSTQILFFEVDLLKQGMTKEEVKLNFFPYPTVSEPNVDSVPHFFFRQFPLDVLPAWGDLQTGYTEVNVSVNLDLRKWATYFFPPVSLDGQTFKELQDEGVVAKMEIEIRDMTSPDFSLTPVSLVEIADPLNRNTTQELDWNNELVQSKGVAEFREDDFSILKLPANIYNPNGISTSEYDKKNIAEAQRFEYSQTKGSWHAGYQMNVKTNINEEWFRATGLDNTPRPPIRRTFSIPENLNRAHINLIRRIRPDVDRAFPADINVARWYIYQGVKEFDEATIELIATQPIQTDLNVAAANYIRVVRPDINSATTDGVKLWYVIDGIKELSDENLNRIRELAVTTDSLTRDHFHLNRNNSESVKNTEAEGVINFFPYERPWDELYPEPIKIPRVPRVRNPRWRGAYNGDPNIYIPKYLDGDLIGLPDANVEAGGWGLELKPVTGTKYAGLFSKRATKNFVYKYEGNASSTLTSYANGYSPTQDIEALSSVLDGENYQRVECGHAYFMRVEGWPGALHGPVFDRMFADNSYGSLNRIVGSYRSPDLKTSVKAGSDSPKKEGDIQIFKIVNPDPENIYSQDPIVTPSFITIGTEQIWRRRDEDNDKLKMGYAINNENGQGKAAYMYPHFSDKGNFFSRFTIEIQNVGQKTVRDPFREGAKLRSGESSEFLVQMESNTTIGDVDFQFSARDNRMRLTNINITLDGNDDFDPGDFSFKKAKYNIIFKNFSNEGKDANLDKSRHVLNIDAPSQLETPVKYFLNQGIDSVQTNFDDGKDSHCSDKWKSTQNVYIHGIILGAGSGSEKETGIFLTDSLSETTCGRGKLISTTFGDTLRNIGWRIK